ncbi:MAG TPA: hypothetical protein DCZ10_01925 [Pelotomaculum sp.]|nr:hypothetical protein [Pelotomaculum sp.]
MYKEHREYPHSPWRAFFYSNRPDSRINNLEAYSHNASKYNAVNYIRNCFRFETIIGFGDNLNDIPLFNACDECYAVSNAIEQLKEKATGVIADNDSEGVAQFIAERESLWIRY